jgi:hypothetical protein
MSTTGWIVLGIVVVAVFWAISIYNGLVAMRQRTNQAFADIDVQLKQRHDLVPNLIETVEDMPHMNAELWKQSSGAQRRDCGTRCRTESGG